MSGPAILLAALVLFAGCEGPRRAAVPAPGFVEPPGVRFAVISDPHLYDAAALGAEGEDFAEEIAGDRKMVVESGEILAEALRRVKASGARFLLVAGDLTHEGARVDHERVAALLADVERAGVAVYVVPGNHDILNPDAAGFGPEGRRPVPGVSPLEFAGIHGASGFDEALRRDPGSLSYVAEPVPGLWLLGIDTCRYAENRPGAAPVTGGRLAADSLAWVEAVLADARRLGKTAIVLQHHGLVEHFTRQAKSFPAYLVEDHARIAGSLATNGVRAAFTGHYHAQDIVLARFPDGSFLFDVMTGSLATVPSVRIVTLDAEGGMTLRSESIDSLPSFEAAGRDFEAYAGAFVHERITGIAAASMRNLRVSAADAAALAPWIADAFLANYRGDERLAGVERLSTKGLGLVGRSVAVVYRSRIEALWDDLEPADNDLVIDLATGSWRTLR